jgi:hypothetical protein
MVGRTITQRISLVGGDEIKVQLEGIGNAAQVAFRRVAATGTADAGLNRFGLSLDGVRKKMETVARAGAGVGDALVKVGERVGAVGERLGLVIGLSLAGATKKMVDIARSTGDAVEDMENSAAALGVSTKELKAYQNVASLAGIESEQLQKGLTKLIGSANEAAKSDQSMAKAKRELARELQTGKINYMQYTTAVMKLNETAKENANAFEKLGVSVTNADGSMKDALELFRETGQALSELPEGTRRSGLAMDLFGAKNAKLLRLSVMNREEFEKQRKEISRLTASMSDAERNGLETFADRFMLLGKVISSTRTKFVAMFAPSMTKIVDALSNRIADLRNNFLGYVEVLQSKVVPLVDDIAAAIEGRDADVKNASVLKFRDAVVQAANDIKNAITGIIIPAFGTMMKVLDTMATMINAVFGSQLTGGEILAAAAILRLTGVLAAFGAIASAVKAAVVGLIAVFGAWPVAIAAAGFAIGFLIVTTINRLGGLQEIARRVLTGIPILFQIAFDGVLSIVTGILNALGGLFNKLSGGITAGAKAMWEGVTGTFKAGVDGVVNFFTSLPGRITEAFKALVKMATDAWKAIVDSIADVGKGIVDTFNAALDRVKSFFKSLYDEVSGYLKNLLKTASDVASKIAEAMGGGGGGGDAPAFAEGGPVRGRGTGTSDSILARLSNGEFVMRAAAVRKWGVSMLAAMNGLRNPFKGGLAFANGGLVDFADSMLPNVPRFAAGGVVHSGLSGGGSNARPFTLNIGGESFGGLSAEQDTVERLQRFAVTKRIRSAGRKPTWFQG